MGFFCFRLTEAETMGIFFKKNYFKKLTYLFDEKIRLSLSSLVRRSRMDVYMSSYKSKISYSSKYNKRFFL